MTQATFQTWLLTTQQISHTDNALVVSVASTYAKDWLEQRLLQTIERTVSRLAGQTTTVQLVLSSTITPAPTHKPETDTTAPHDRDLPTNCQFGIELVTFDPLTKGFVMTSNYALQFWRPYLSAIEREHGARSGGTAFALWQTLRSFPAAWQSKTNLWPSIQTLADMICNGNRHRILGRAPRQARKYTTGALEILEQQRIVWPRAQGHGRDTLYFFRVLDTLPLLTPVQILRLTPRLQERHQRVLARCKIDFEDWVQLTLPTLLTED